MEEEDEEEEEEEAAEAEEEPPKAELTAEEPGGSGLRSGLWRPALRGVSALVVQDSYGVALALWSFVRLSWVYLGCRVFVAAMWAW